MIRRNLGIFFAAMVLTIMIALAGEAFAGGNKYHHDDSSPPPVINTNTNTTTILSSSTDISAGIATAMAAGGHQFDFSTTDWQGSIVGAWQFSGDEENNASFAIGKRFDGKFLPNTMFHVTYTPNGNDNWMMIGGTFRF